MPLYKAYMKKLMKAGLSVFLCAAVAVSVAFIPTNVSAASLSEMRQRQQELQNEKEANDAKLQELRNNTAEKENYRDEIYNQISTVQSQLDLLRESIDALDKKIAEDEAAIADKQQSIDENYELLKQRIKVLYVAGDASTLAIILKSRSLMDYTKKTEILQAITAHDKQLIETLDTQLKDIEADLVLINTEKVEISNIKKQQEAASEELGRLYESAQALLEEAQQNEAAAAAYSENLGTQIEEYDASIAELEEQLKSQMSTGGGDIGNLGGDGYLGSGSFVWPMPGYTYITCYFGDGGHRGIDIAGGSIYGKAIVAADGGSVIYAGWNDSYGNCVFIDHGNGFQTRYAHMSALGTYTGANVVQGEVIGYVGSTGNSTGPHLHFEVIYNGGVIDPFNYF